MKLSFNFFWPDLFIFLNFLISFFALIVCGGIFFDFVSLVLRVLSAYVLFIVFLSFRVLGREYYVLIGGLLMMVFLILLIIVRFYFDRMVLFYFFFELSVIPIYLYILMWGGE